MAAFSHVLVGVPVIVILFVHYLYQTKKDSFYNMLTLAVAINANVISKLIVKEYRPFLQFEPIKALNCECSFGMPSGHSATVTIGVLVMLDSLIQARNSRKKKALSDTKTTPIEEDYKNAASFSNPSE